MVKLGLIGVGRWGKNILRTLEGMKGVEVAAITDKKQRVPEDVSGVLVATPGSTHARIALPYVKMGLPVFIEKPMATSVREAVQLEKTAQKSGSQIFVGHVHLYNPAYLKLKQLLPKIGAIKLIHFEGMAPGPVRDDMSVLWDWGPHGVSMMLDVLSASPQRAQAWGQKILKPKGKIHDAVQARLLFAGGVQTLLSLSWVNPEKRVKLTVIGSGGALVFDDAQPSLANRRASAGKLATGKMKLYQGTKISYPSYGAQLPLTQELAAFVRTVKTGTQPATNVTQGAQVVRVLAAVEEALQ
jgi:predicted dehydrogenase